MQPTISIYIGRTLLGSEAAYLRQLVQDLGRNGSDAVVLANFEVIGNTGTRQVDFIAVTPTRAQLQEEKELHGPIQGGINGRWKFQDRSGQWIAFDRVENPIAQVIATKNALNDAMEKFQRKSLGTVPTPLDGKFYKQFEALVVVWPLLDPASKIEVNSQKARVVGYTDAVRSLTTDQLASSWGLNEWRAFADHLNLTPVTLREAIDATVFAANDRLDQYRVRFEQCFAPDLAALVAIARENTIGIGLVERLVSDRHVLLVGPSGTTKSFHLRHAALTTAKRGGVPLFLRPIGRWIDFKHLVFTSIAAHTKSSADDFLRDIKSGNKDLHVFVDGLNEFSHAATGVVLEGLLWLQSTYNARVVIATTQAPKLPEPLEGDTIPLADITPAHKAAIFKYYCGQSGPLVEDFLIPFQNAFDVIVAAESNGDLAKLGLGGRYDRFVRQRLSVENQAAALAILRALASHMAEDAYSAMPLDEFDRFVELELVRVGAPLGLLDSLKSSALLVVNDNAISFKHERLLRYFQAEAVRRRNDTAEKMVRDLERPACRTISGFIVERLDGSELRHVLEHIPDSQLLSEVARGLWGATVKNSVETSLRRTLTDLVAELPNMDILWQQVTYEKGNSATFPKRLISGRPWSKYEHQLLRLVGSGFGVTSWDHEILDILQLANDHFTRLIAKAAEEAEPKLPYRYLTSEFLRVVVSLHHGNDDDPFTSLLAGMNAGGLVYAKSRVKAFYEALDKFTNGDTSNVFILLLMIEAMHMLDVDDRNPDQCLRLISAGWNTGIHILRTSALQVAESCAILQTDKNPGFKEKLSDLLGQMKTKNPLLSSQLTEVQANLGAIEIGLTVDDAVAEFRKAISATPDEVKEICNLSQEMGFQRTPEQYIGEFAMSAISKIFEDVFQGIYWDAYVQLTEDERVELLCRATVAEDTFFTDWVIAELTKLGSQKAVPSLAARCAQVKFTAVFRQDAMGAYFLALAGHAKLGEAEPLWQMPSSPINDAWRLVGLIWWHQFHSKSEGRDACGGYWATLIAELPFQAVEVLSVLQTDHHARMNEITKGVDILSRYPEQYRQLFEHALANRTNLPPDMIGCSLSTAQFVVQVLGHVGTKETIDLLKPFTGDAELGKLSLEAIAEIRRRCQG